jgi:3-oxoadipate enol-lactonase
MPTVQAGPHTVYYDEYGTGDPVLLIAGLSHSRLAWWKQIGPLAAAYRVITPDNRDAGDSALGTGGYAISDMAEDMAILIDSLHLGPAYIIGWSMGGHISLELTVRHPGLVKKLILVATSAGGFAHVPPKPEIAAAILPQRGENAEALLRRVNPLLAGPEYMTSHPEDLEQMIRHAFAKPMTGKSFQRQLGAIMSWRGVANRLFEITAPTLILHGDADPLVPYPNGKYLAAHIPGAKFITYHQVGHLLPIEAADRFNQDVINFLG